MDSAEILPLTVKQAFYVLELLGMIEYLHYQEILKARKYSTSYSCNKSNLTIPVINLKACVILRWY
jgi:hypothetical protein